jgi:hypothetical protein
MFERDFVIDLRKDSASIIRFISEVVEFSRECHPFSFLTNSIRIREGPRNSTDFFDEGSITNTKIGSKPQFESSFHGIQVLDKITAFSFTEEIL